MPRQRINPNSLSYKSKFEFADNGALSGTRTLGPLIKSQLLYQPGQFLAQSSKQPNFPLILSHFFASRIRLSDLPDFTRFTQVYELLIAHIYIGGHFVAFSDLYFFE